MNETEQKIIANEPNIGSGDTSICLPGWIKSFCEAFEAGKGMNLSHNAVRALCHTLIAGRVRVERLVDERNELQRFYDDAQQIGMDMNL